MSRVKVTTINEINTTDNTQLCDKIKIGWLTMCSENNGYYLLNENNSIIGKILIRALNAIYIELLNDIINSEDSIWSYEIVPKQNNSQYGSKHYKMDIYIDVDKFLEKCDNNTLTKTDCMFLHKLITMNYSEQKNKKFTEDWKNAHIMTRNDVVLTQPTSVNIKLYTYQIKSMMWMKSVEENIDKDGWNFDTFVPLSSIIKDPKVDGIYFDMLDRVIVTDQFKPHTFKAKGGILADEMGLGKTITTVSLMLARPSNYKKLFAPNGKYFSKSNLIVCPNHLTKQWQNEILKCNPLAKCVLVLTKPNHEGVTYDDFFNADFVITSIQFLINVQHYVCLNYKKITPAYLTSKFNDREIELNKMLEGLKNQEIKEVTKYNCPMFEHFHWNRLIIDEAHEQFGNMSSFNSSETDNYVRLWLSNITSNYKWYVSGTPFTHEQGFASVIKFLGLNANKRIKLPKEEIINIPIGYEELTSEGIDFNTVYQSVMQNMYYRNTKVSVGPEFNIPAIVEETIFLNLTNIERSIYNSNLHLGSEYLRQLCCHPNISDHDIETLGAEELSLEQVRQKLIEHKKKIYEEKEKKLKDLIKEGPTAHGYDYRKKKYEEEMKGLQYLINFFEKLDPVVPALPEETCAICMCEFDDAVVTECGHYFCKECIYTALQMTNKSCPTCRTPLTIKNVYPVKKNADENKVDYFTYKYGSKMGKLISLCKQIFANPENRIIIFSQWDRLLNNIGKTLKDASIESLICKGNVHQRNAAISSFKKGLHNGKECRVILLSIEHCASGVNLTEADSIFIVDQIDGKKEEIKSIENQAIGRAARLGQTKQVKVIRLITKDTIEEEIYKKNH